MKAARFGHDNFLDRYLNGDCEAVWLDLLIPAMWVSEFYNVPQTRQRCCPFPSGSG